MRYSAELVDQLACEYVLGTLHGPARRRFERLCRERGDARLLLWRWERDLHGLLGNIEPVVPPKRVWSRIQKRIRPTEGGLQRLWKTLAAAVPVAAATAWLVLTLVPQTGFDRLAVFQENGSTLWVIRTDTVRNVLETRAINAKPPDSGVFQLWALPEGQKPTSMGLLSVSKDRIGSRLSEDTAAAVAASQNLAISIEPVGGSPTGLPTGPVVFQAPVVEL